VVKARVENSGGASSIIGLSQKTNGNLLPVVEGDLLFSGGGRQGPNPHRCAVQASLGGGTVAVT